ncbi:MAG: hypothetical protein ACRDCK_01220, partial [Plesiomonas shigelloides]
CRTGNYQRFAHYQALSSDRTGDIYPFYLKLQRCWLRLFTPITLFADAHEDSLTCRLPATSRCLGILCFLGALFGVMMNGGDDESVVLREIKKRPYWRFFGVYENSLAYSIF